MGSLKIYNSIHAPTHRQRETEHSCALFRAQSLFFFCFFYCLQMAGIRTGQTAEQDEHRRTVGCRLHTFQMEFGNKNVTVNPLEREGEVFFVLSVLRNAANLVWACGAKVNNSHWEPEVHKGWQWYSVEEKTKRGAHLNKWVVWEERILWAAHPVMYLKADTARADFLFVCMCVCMHDVII